VGESLKFKHFRDFSFPKNPTFSAKSGNNHEEDKYLNTLC
jgi:hypothetical protein